MADLSFLPYGGRFKQTKTRNFIEDVIVVESQKPGPGSYNPVQQSFERLPQGGRFFQSNPKSDIDWLIYESKNRPGPGEYAPKQLSSDGGVISQARSKSALDWVIYHAEQTPGPGQYETAGMPLPEGGRFNISNAKSELDQVVFDASRAPGPAQYDFPRWPSPSHGRFAAPMDQHSLLDHLAPKDGSVPPRPMSTLDQYRDNSFKLPPSERRRRAKEAIARSTKLTEKIVEKHTNKEFAAQRIEKARRKGQGTAEDAIDQIFDHLARTKSKVMDIFMKIDKDGNGGCRPPHLSWVDMVPGLLLQSRGE